MVSSRISSENWGRILFLDELNMAPPVMQGVAQQLILDRKIEVIMFQMVGRYYHGNRKEDRLRFEMPALS